jgi:hypothetical protein
MNRKKLTPTQLWMMAHPDDVPCPQSPDSAAAWRKKRGLSDRNDAQREKYEAALAEMKERSGAGG